MHKTKLFCRNGQVHDVIPVNLTHLLTFIATTIILNEFISTLFMLRGQNGRYYRSNQEGNLYPKTP